MNLVVASLDDLEAIVSASVDAAVKRAQDDTPARPDIQWVTNRDAVDLLGVSKNTLQRYRNDGKIAFSQEGQKIWYRKSDIEDMLCRNLRIPNEAALLHIIDSNISWGFEMKISLPSS